MSIKKKMILSAIAAVSIPFLIVGMIIHFQLSRSLLGITKDHAVHAAEDLSWVISAALDQEKLLATSIAADPDIIEACEKEDFSTAQQELEQIWKGIGKDYFTIFLLDQKGIDRVDVRFDTQVGLDLSDRQYFMDAKSGKASVAGPFFPRGESTFEEAVIIISVPIMNGDTFLGAVCIPHSIQFIANMLETKKIGETGFAFLVDAQGLLLVHPIKQLSLNFNIKDLPGTEEIIRMLKAHQTGASSYYLIGEEQIVGLYTVPLTGWKVIYSQNKKEIMAPLNRLLSTISLLGVLFLLITIVTMLVMTRKFSSPIEKMVQTMKEVTTHSSEVILQINRKRKIIYANPTFETITGLSADEIKGTEPDLSNHKYMPEEKIWRILEGGNSWSGRINVEGIEGPVTLDVMLVPMRDDKNHIAGYLEIGRDITNELMFEKRMQQSQKLEAIGTMAGGISHDFNNILSGIFGYAQLTLMRSDKVPHVRKYMHEILTASERARDLVSQILTFSRQTDVSLTPLQPKIVINEAITLLRASIPAKIDLQTRLSTDAFILADATQLHQVVMNLCVNAAHAIGDNSGTIGLELEDFQVDESFMATHPDIKTGRHVMLRIIDTGCGMPPEFSGKIFEPFFTTKNTGEGSGLGLSVVHGIVKNLSGIITVYSEIEKGTTFNILIPATAEKNIAPGDQRTDAPVGSERVVVIDDEPAITTSVQSILSNLGYHVTAFTDSAEALAAIRNQADQFDIIITDFSMPGMTGLELAKEIRAVNIQLPIILTSGFLGQGMESVAMEAGISRLILKPINPYKLAGAIRRILESNEN